MIAFERLHDFFCNIFNHENAHFNAFQIVFFDVKPIFFENLFVVDMKTFMPFEFERKDTTKSIDIV